MSSQQEKRTIHERRRHSRPEKDGRSIVRAIESARRCNAIGPTVSQSGYHAIAVCTISKDLKFYDLFVALCVRSFGSEIVIQSSTSPQFLHTLRRLVAME